MSLLSSKREAGRSPLGDGVRIRRATEANDFKFSQEKAMPSGVASKTYGWNLSKVSSMERCRLIRSPGRWVMTLPKRSAGAL